MKDIPFFATQSGVASLILHQIPYKSEAYIEIRHAADIKALLKECCDFCRAAGANKIYATGNPFLEQYPVHTSVLQMSCYRDNLSGTDAQLIPVTQDNSEQWRQIYNERMNGVHSAVTMTIHDMQKLCAAGGAYFVFNGDSLIGIGAAKNDKISVVTSVKPGNGENIVKALNGVLNGKIVFVEVSSNNEKAVQLYERLGFKTVNEIIRWYQIK